MAKLYFFKIVFLLIATNLFTICAEAQYFERERLFFGAICAGANFTQVDGDNFAGYHKAGLNLSGLVYIRLGQKFAPSFELCYAQKGSRSGNNQYALANDKQTGFKKYRINLNYAELPLLLNYFDEKKSNFGAGFSFSYLMTSKESYTTSTGITYEQDAKLFPFRKTDVNFLLNGNAHIWKGIFINLRYAYSLYSIRKNFNPFTGRAQQFNNIWTARMMYLF